MCGIFGLIVESKSGIAPTELNKWVKHLAKRSTERGKDSSGFVFLNTAVGELNVIKGDIPANVLMKSAEFRAASAAALKSYSANDRFFAMGHARLVTNGSQLFPENNQPVVKDRIVAVHNGIIVNNDALWQKYPELRREYVIDTEILLALVTHRLSQQASLESALRSTLAELTGTVSTALFVPDQNKLALYTNNGSLHFGIGEKFFVFASERAFLQSFAAKFPRALTIHSFQPDELKIIDLHSGSIGALKFTSEIVKGSASDEIVVNPASFSKDTGKRKLLEPAPVERDAINALKRCTRCILPSTFPFISFDSDGVCNICRNYVPRNQANNKEALYRLAESIRSAGRTHDCLIPFSGGRDSTYTLHYVKRELGLNPVAFTYDWGMVTDVARRNAARVCGKLGVENFIVAADIRKKRRNIRLNIAAWLKKPALGMVPLFMAGDKYFFYHCNRLLDREQLPISVWGSNPLENTDFKSGFAGARPATNKKRIDDLRISDKLRVAGYFASNFFGNLGYVNQSIADTVGAFGSRYMVKRRGYIQLFDYMVWDEKTVDELIMNEYEWEKSVDSPSTWRIGDGTAAFYNHIYYSVAGFSEFDTFRSNQIREGQLDRATALKLAEAENQPRYENLRWYTSVLNLDFERTIQTIRKIPRLYHVD